MSFQTFSILDLDTINKYFYTYIDPSCTTNHVSEVVDCQHFLPSSLQQLAGVSACVWQDSRPVFQEVVTLSPGYEHVHNSLLPVFVVPVLGSLSLQPLTSRLLHPAFCSSLPATYSTVEQHARFLVQVFLFIHSLGES